MLNFRRQNPNRIAAEITETPLELARTPGHWLELFGPALPLSGTRVRPFVSSQIAAGVRLYTAGTNAPTLIAGFSGRSQRLMLPPAAILQHLDERQFDLLLLTDNRSSHFGLGIGGYARSFYQLCKRIGDFKQARGYRHLITYGTSMGALAALRAGELAQADRSIGMGARYAWDVRRLLRGDRPPAFDPICHCRPAGGGRAFALYSDGMAEDERDAHRLHAVMPGCTIIPLPWHLHNPVARIFRNDRLEDFQQMIFDLDRTPDGVRLQAMLA